MLPIAGQGFPRLLAVFRSLHSFIHSTVYRGTPNSVPRTAVWENLVWCRYLHYKRYSCLLLQDTERRLASDYLRVNWSWQAPPNSRVLSTRRHMPADSNISGKRLSDFLKGLRYLQVDFIIIRAHWKSNI